MTAARPWLLFFALASTLGACSDPASPEPDAALDAMADASADGTPEVAPPADAADTADTPETQDADVLAEVSLSPADWPAGELAYWTGRNAEFPAAPETAEGTEMLIAGTSNALAIRAGYEALQRGGTAADAVTAAAMAQVTLAAGSYVSFGGIFFMTYYDAASGETHHLNAGYQIPLGEADPMSIPAQGSGIPSGRTALVPGFFAGIEAAHERFGALPFEALFEPSIYFAETGFELTYVLGYGIASKSDVLTRLDETAAVFTRDAETGALYTTGDRFTQPALAATLRRVATEGVDHIYTGDWAERFVAAVQAEGGTLTLEDMAAYQAEWTEPLITTHEDATIVAPGLPGTGGVDIVLAFNLLAEAGLAQIGHYAESATALFWLAQILRASILSFLTDDQLGMVLPGVDLSPSARATGETAAAVWDAMQGGQFFFTITPAPPGGTHSDALVAVDAEGNVAAVVHSINTLMRGETGIFVDGISIPDSACFQQQAIAAAGPGNRLPDPTNPFLALIDGRPRLASASINSALHARSVSMAWNVLAFGHDAPTAQALPALGFPDLTDPTGPGIVERVRAGDFPAPLLTEARALGLTIDEVDPTVFSGVRGWWVGITFEPDGSFRGVSTEELNGAAIGR